ncbi:hypothetical protein PTTG_26873 [Puccinia triticina 1-1 BBBD Race 1]|uniref:Uncharacterized protein n=1 Tax=Puccinia triticina (isolate 1-1 / race 1 (BBBD)) TaxID=630390 RepID=A0A180GPL5_PUCT1|nr:hypothetical protein PTTG_26873 [Puccinia triticina 1-1 BBBD Race 1]
MHRQSPAAMRSSANLERMDVLLKATGISAHVTVPSCPPIKLDVEACYNQLSQSDDQRPEDVVMRQALELYCSLLSPATTPTQTFKSGYQSEQDRLPFTPSGVLNCEDEYRPLSIVFDEPQACDLYDAADLNRPDADDMDDPFACYPLFHSLRLTPHSSYTAHEVNPTPFRRQSSEQFLEKDTHSYLSQEQIQTSAQSSISSVGKSFEIARESAADVRAQGSVAQSLARRSLYSAAVEPSVPEPKSTGRKQTFSMILFAKQRKVTPTNHGLRISGPKPIDTSHSASSSGTFSVPARPPRPPGARLLSAGSLSPPLEANEDITPVKHFPSKLRVPSRSSTLPQEEAFNPMSLPRKYPSRPEMKSLWTTIKTSTSRSSLSVDRSMIRHLNVDL